MEKEKAGAATAGKKETWKKKEILDILRDWGYFPGPFLRPMIKQLFNYRSKTGKNEPKQSRGRIVRVKHKNAIRGDIKGIQYHSEGIARNTLRGKTSNTSNYNTLQRIPGNRRGYNLTYTIYIYNYTMVIYKAE